MKRCEIFVSTDGPPNSFLQLRNGLVCFHVWQQMRFAMCGFDGDSEPRRGLVLFFFLFVLLEVLLFFYLLPSSSPSQSELDTSPSMCSRFRSTGGTFHRQS